MYVKYYPSTAFLPSVVSTLLSQQICCLENHHLRQVNCGFRVFATPRVSESRDRLWTMPSVSGEKELKPKISSCYTTSKQWEGAQVTCWTPSLTLCASCVWGLSYCVHAYRGFDEGNGAYAADLYLLIGVVLVLAYKANVTLVFWFLNILHCYVLLSVDIDR